MRRLNHPRPLLGKEGRFQLVTSIRFLITIQSCNLNLPSLPRRGRGWFSRGNPLALYGNSNCEIFRGVLLSQVKFGVELSVFCRLFIFLTSVFIAVLPSRFGFGVPFLCPVFPRLSTISRRTISIFPLLKRRRAVNRVPLRVRMIRARKVRRAARLRVRRQIRARSIVRAPRPITVWRRRATISKISHRARRVRALRL